MTEEAFHRMLRKEKRWDSLVFYLIAIAAFAAGIYSAIDFSKYWANSLLIQKIFLVAGPAFFFHVSVVICWRLPRLYITAEVRSDKTILEKQRIIEAYLNTL